MNTSLPAKFSPQDASEKELFFAYLNYRISTLDKESLADFAALAQELAHCDDENVFVEIRDAMREIIFPEKIGAIHEAPTGQALTTDKLQKRMNWIGGRIKEFREKKEWTQEQLAAAAGIQQSHVSRLEAGVHSPARFTLEKIAKALDVEVGELDPAE